MPCKGKCLCFHDNVDFRPFFRRNNGRVRGSLVVAMTSWMTLSVAPGEVSVFP